MRIYAGIVLHILSKERFQGIQSTYPNWIKDNTVENYYWVIIHINMYLIESVLHRVPKKIYNVICIFNLVTAVLPGH